MKYKTRLLINGILLVFVGAIMKLKGYDSASYLLVAGLVSEAIAIALFVLEDRLHSKARQKAQ